VVDNGDGTYTVPISYGPSGGTPPGVIIGQPGRPPAVISSPTTNARHRCCRWELLVCVLLLVILILVLLLLLT
jgi:hypothetical protein